MKMLSNLLEHVNFSKRIRLDWVSAAEGNRFAQLVKEFTKNVENLGPNPIKDSKLKTETLDDLNAVKSTLTDIRLRGLIARKRELITDGNVHGEILSSEKFEKILEDATQNEFIRNKIMEKIKEKGKSVPDIAKEINIESYKVLEHIVTLRARGLVDVYEINEEIPTFISIKEV